MQAKNPDRLELKPIEVTLAVIYVRLIIVTVILLVIFSTVNDQISLSCA